MIIIRKAALVLAFLFVALAPASAQWKPQECLSAVVCGATVHSVSFGGFQNHIGQFNPNLFGGNWTCFRSAASGTCGAATTHYFDAACDGVSDDSTALDAFTIYGIAQNPAIVNLYIPPGSNCKLPGKNTFTCYPCVNGIGGSDIGINVVNIWAYGATVDNAFFGGLQFYQDDLHSARINTVSAGSTTVTVNDGNIGRFSQNDFIWVTGICLDAGGGFPFSFQLFDNRQITAINGNVINLSAPLSNSYKSTWPVCGLSSGTSGGPATIFKSPPSWNTQLQLFGLTVTNGVGAQINFNLRSAMVRNVSVLNGSIAPSTAVSFESYYSNFNGGIEIDKENVDMKFFYGVINQPAAQTASPVNLIFEGVTIYCSINGTAQNTLINHVTVIASGCDGQIGAGPTSYGHGNSLIVTNSTFVVANTSQVEFLVSDFTSFSAGTFVLAKSAPSSAIGTMFAWGVPGYTYKFAYHNSKAAACTPLTTFNITDMREDGSNYYVDTNIVGSLPTPDCSGGSPAVYTAYPAQTITQTNTGGSPSLTQFAPP